MAENITGIESSIWGGSSHFSFPFSSRCIFWSFFPRYTRVSIGSRSGSMGGLVTCEALTRILSQYTGSFLGVPMEESNTPPVEMCIRDRYITLRQMPGLKETAAKWFHDKWKVPQEAYLACMRAYLDGETEYGWKDLTPNVCAVYTEREYRNQGIAGRLLDIVVKDMKSKEISPIYLITDHTGFYERYGWEFLCMVQGDHDPEMTRMYIHR